MATIKQKQLRVDDTIMVVAAALEDRPDVPLEGLKEIARRVSGIADRDAKNARILELADAMVGNTPKG